MDSAPAFVVSHADTDTNLCPSQPNDIFSKLEKSPDNAEVVFDFSQPILYSPTISALVARLLSYMPDADDTMVRRSFAVACIAHEGQKRQSGEPYIDHPVAVATILLDLQMDAISIAAALLHDVVEDTKVGLSHIETIFGSEIALLVDGVTKLSVLEAQSKEEAQAGTYRKMFIAMADDPRVVLIKLADRLHNMRTLGAMSPERQQRIARETLDIYAPLAHRLGIWQVKSELEDLSFKTLKSDKYREIAQQLTLRREARERIIQRVIARLRIALDREGITAQISGRPKHIYSIYRKMERKGISLDQIYDKFAVRVIVNEVNECYRVLGIVHNLWTPILSEFDDYIAVPKESMYRSLHTTVLIPGGTPCEVQIRTQEMHEVAEHGIAAHWRYKEGFGKSDRSFETKITWLRSLIDWRREMTDAREFIESLKADMFEEQVYVFTPKGKIIDLPVGSTPVDFAYRIHSEVGHRCAGAKVNNRMAPLDYQIQNAEIVQIMTSRAPRGPSRDWLNFVKTDSARSHIKRYFRRLERDENIAAGRDLLEKELKRLGLSAVAFDDIVSIWGARSIEDLFALIGSGETTARQVAQKVLAQRAETQDDLAEIPQITPSPRPSATDILVRGESNLLTRMAKCCNPVVGEPIVGYITRGKGVTVHRADCRTILNERDRERLVDVAWGSNNPTGYPVPVRIESWDRVGLWRDVSGAIADAEINIDSVSQRHTRRSGRAVLVVVLKIQSINQLTMILDKLNRIPDVIEARRESYSAAQLA
ncbi:MAG: bifunctional (p)ppGpp synthetase/guanosine-3',5'-bis(diphosphate) 3'-pyrophosphohydrolase [Chloroflexales bacterium]|nr:bifunctional (p)ppGpp synthetase/guanosine-3',5'-bis(diphosphate) 3'-pyrophosphohydrolase [Chloroflexales bacterium]